MLLGRAFSYWQWPLVIVAALLALAGCEAKEERVPVVPVTGKVLVDGQPAERATVIFHLRSGSEMRAEATGVAPPTPTGEVKPDGTFALNSYTAGDGAPPGDYAVSIIWPQGTSQIGGDADTGDRLGGKYANPETSGLRATVGSSATEIPAFELKSK